MADTTARALRLLSLFQRRRYWPGPELARRLEVSERTLRRDVDRLRALGYPVETARGVAGGYWLEPGEGLAPLLLDDDEAVALAVGLHLAARGDTDLAEASISALAKVLALLPAAQRHRADALRTTTALGPGPPDDAPSLGVLAVVADACRDQVRLSFAYRAADQAETQRYVEPYRLVAVGYRWYLVAYDIDRSDWRTFRVDRLSDPAPATNSFAPREPPADDLYAYVQARLGAWNPSYRVVVEVERPAIELRARLGRWVVVEELSANRSGLTIDTEDLDWAVHVLAAIEAPFVVHEPLELQQRLVEVAARFADAAGAPAVEREESGAPTWPRTRAEGR